MCSFCIRETGIRQVVYAIPSPIMGGYSKWNILGGWTSPILFPRFFVTLQEIVSGLMESEAEQVWREWHPIDWAVLRHRHAIGKTAPEEVRHADEPPPLALRIWKGLLSRVHSLANG